MTDEFEDEGQDALRTIEMHKVNPCNDLIDITVLDEPGHGGACHEYLVTLYNHSGDVVDEGLINFQNGPILESGVNGITQEVLLAILIDRLKAFHAGPYSCDENYEALTHCRLALRALNARTIRRMNEGVEGTSKL